ncbi:hypothetical protein BEN78_08685 [Xanthomonas citri pv. mangiferaeindicae]|nr:hypothetical protein BEN78_08685 [Xanthomonas citri pv. mangiferaeindicae]
MLFMISPSNTLPGAPWACASGIAPANRPIDNTAAPIVRPLPADAPDVGRVRRASSLVTTQRRMEAFQRSA